MFAEKLAKVFDNIPANVDQTPLDPSEISMAGQVRTAISSITGATWMGPNQPMVPIAPKETLPRAFDYPFGTNLYFQPRQEQPGRLGFYQLRQLARYDIVRLCIETRKAQIAEMDWSFQVDQTPGEKKHKFKQRNDQDPRVTFLTEFFKRPDREHSFQDWLNMLLEEIFVTDALSIWPVMNDQAQVLALRLIDGGTVKPLHDAQGWTPAPPNPAYSQILKGMPALNLTSGLCDQCTPQDGGRAFRAKDHRCMPLVYAPFNPSVNLFYGFGQVEAIANTILLGMNRQVSQTSLYTEGNIPEAIAEAPENWNDEQIMRFQAFLDTLAGDVTTKRRIRMMPALHRLTFPKEALIKDDRDEWIARICCYALSVAPNPLVRQMNRASAQNITESAISEGKLPTLNKIAEVINYCVGTMMRIDGVKFVWDVDQEADLLKQSQIDASDVKTGIRSIDECREDRGLPPIGAPNFILLPTGPILVSSLSDGTYQAQQDEAHQARIAAATQPKQLEPGEANLAGNGNGTGKKGNQAEETIERVIKLLVSTEVPAEKKTRRKLVY